MKNVIREIRTIFKDETGFIPLHRPLFSGKEKDYLMECIDSTFVSSIGEFVSRFERQFSEFTGSNFTVATMNGTSALHLALHAIRVDHRHEVITQPLTFVATCNAISYTGAKPVFIDVDYDTMGMSPKSLDEFLQQNCRMTNNECINRVTGKRIKACVPMHTFGFPCRIEEITDICKSWNIDVIEDSAESLGSMVGQRHTGTFGKMGIFSFNGNKVITAGGGGCIITNDESLAKRLKYLSTTAKETHPWEYIHNETGFNYRMPNINAALLCAQLEKLPEFLIRKRLLARKYIEIFKDSEISVKVERENTIANYWLNTIELKNKEERDMLLEMAIKNKIMIRPAWRLMNTLPMYQNCFSAPLKNSLKLSECILNIPSSVI